MKTYFTGLIKPEHGKHGVKRGWGKFFSKSCKAKHQERITGQYRNYLNNQSYDDDLQNLDDELGWDAHKDTY